jgi:hypothetical protein
VRNWFQSLVFKCSLYRYAWVLSYLRQLAIVTPYAQFHFRYTAGSDSRGNMDATSRRRTEAGGGVYELNPVVTHELGSTR